MREIKFRVWDKEEKVMMYQRDEWFVDDEYDLLTFPLETKNIILCGGSESFIPLQYTGLKDKNGKEIYESDILQDDENFYWEVFYEGAGFWVRCKDLMAVKRLRSWDGHEIVGNLYENPELLKKGE